MTWDLQLEQASFRGVEFECQTIDDDLERRIVEYEFQGRDGAELEDKGRKARTTSVQAVFFGDSYEAELGALLQVIDEGKKGRFNHPILGAWDARIRRSSVKHSHDERDMATVILDVIEDGTNTTIPDLFSVKALEQEVTVWADIIIEESTLAEAVDAASAAKSFVASAASAAAQLEHQLNQVQKKIDNAIRTIKKVTNVSNYPVVRALKRTSFSCLKLANTIRQERPQVMAQQVQATLPISLLAHTLYRDAKRADEILSMNTVRNPFIIHVGTELRVYSK